ncbi:MAG: DNA-3-methyladenine glycosylase [Prevotellaceae bacterium]|jgi:DNA-3-methyladenine glycosylase|nr:DNA-3-methyladenine glycosylase [Prevotellaceae bacterium]
MKLTTAFYTRPDVVQISKELLGKTLCTRFDGRLAKAIITETEAYAGITDKASHAYGGRRTKRTEVMFREGGHAYIYLCYGIYSLFNVVTNVAGIPHAVLIRGAIASGGVGIMLQRTGRGKITGGLLSGPGKLAKAMGLHYSQTGTSLTGATIWIEDAGIVIPPEAITITPRIGIGYAAEDALLPYRFQVDREGLSPNPVFCHLCS